MLFRSVHEALAALPGITLLARHEEDDFILDVFQTTPAESVARRTGLLS